MFVEQILHNGPEQRLLVGEIAVECPLEPPTSAAIAAIEVALAPLQKAARAMAISRRRLSHFLRAIDSSVCRGPARSRECVTSRKLADKSVEQDSVKGLF
jgi:hypothetical protein